MKNRPRDKKAGIIILAALIIISLADVILRANVFHDIVSTTANFGDALINAAFSAMLLIFAYKGKDRIFYILCAVFVCSFVMNQLYTLPNMISKIVNAGSRSTLSTVSSVVNVLCIISITAIGGLLVEYMNDGTICNKVFNFLCVATLVMLAFLCCTALNGVFTLGKDRILALLYELSRIAMVFLFAFFAYDSANHELKKVKISK